MIQFKTKEIQNERTHTNRLPLCLALNRVPDDKPKDKANCGKCQVPLFPSEPTSI